MWRGVDCICAYLENVLLLECVKEGRSMSSIPRWIDMESSSAALRASTMARYSGVVSDSLVGLRNLQTPLFNFQHSS